MTTDNKRAKDLIDAVMLEERPCDLCQMIEICATKKLACLAFQKFVITGRPSYAAGMNPRRVIYEKIFNDVHSEADKAEAKLMRELSRIASRLYARINHDQYKGVDGDALFVIVATETSFKALLAVSAYNRKEMETEEDIVGYYRPGGATKLEIYDDIELFTKERQASIERIKRETSQLDIFGESA